MSQENVELHRLANEAFNRRDLEAYIAFCDPQIELHSAVTVPGGAVYHGHAFKPSGPTWSLCVRPSSRLGRMSCSRTGLGDRLDQPRRDGQREFAVRMFRGPVSAARLGGCGSFGWPYRGGPQRRQKVPMLSTMRDASMRDRLARAARSRPRVYRLGRASRAAALSAADAINYLKGNDGELLPPRRYRVVRRDRFLRNGHRFATELVEVGGLKPDSAVLDIGCGVGGKAIPLLDHLGPEGSYCGFDIVPEWVHWCTRRISDRNPAFQFVVADINNGMYNPEGRFDASEYRFPYDPGAFDIAFATSVFTHLMPTEVDNYVKEAARVLRPGGRLLATFFLLDKVSLQRMRAGGTTIRFRDHHSGCFISDPNVPGLAVAYEAHTVRSLYANHGFQVVEPIRHGRWSRRNGRNGHQDLLIARRAS